MSSLMSEILKCAHARTLGSRERRAESSIGLIFMTTAEVCIIEAAVDDNDDEEEESRLKLLSRAEPAAEARTRAGIAGPKTGVREADAAADDAADDAAEDTSLDFFSSS